MMNAKPLKVGEIAKQFGVTTNTIRNWSKRYTEHLSDSANPPGGGERLFTTRDVNVMAYIQSAMNEGMNHNEISVRLGEKTFTGASVDIIVPTPTPQEAPDGPAMLPAVLQSIDSRFQAIERRIEVQAIEARAAQRERVAMLVVGGLGGILLTVGVLAAWVWMMGNGGA
jgi:DNA-binding transcriptional MerR regulator